MVNDERPRVTVLLVVRNGRRFVEEAVESILTQTYTAFDLLIYDEASEDGTRDVLKRFAQHDARITLRLVEHTGKAASLNAGIGEIATEYTALMDADDVALPERLERQVAFLDAQPDLFAVGSQVAVIDAEGRRTRRGRRLPVGRGVVRMATHERLWGPVYTPTVMMRTALARQVGPFRPILPGGDFEYWLRASERFAMDNVDEVLLHYRRHDGNVSGLRGRRRHDVDWNIAARTVERRTTGRDVPPGDAPFHLAEWRGVVPAVGYRVLSLAYAEAMLLRAGRRDDVDWNALREALTGIRPEDAAVGPDGARWLRVWLALMREHVRAGWYRAVLRDGVTVLRWWPVGVRDVVRSGLWRLRLPASEGMR